MLKRSTAVIARLTSCFCRIFESISKPAKMIRPMKVTVIPDDSIVTLSLQICKENRVFNRPITETLEKTVNRITATIGKKKNKKIPKREGAATVNDVPLYNISLLDNKNVKIPFHLNGIDAWKIASVFMIDDQKYNVLFNPPTVTCISLSGLPLAGMTMYPALQFNHSSFSSSRFTWYRSTEKKIHKHKVTSCITSQSDSTKNNQALSWMEVSSDQTYTPSSDDIGHTFKCEVMPGNEKYPVSQQHHGIDSVFALSGVVQNGPDICIFDSRHKSTQGFLSGDDTFRVVCYNILADCYATTNLSLTCLFPYCPEEFINIEYRLQLLLKEIRGYHGDIVCLQEVDRFVFESHLAPVMAMYDYASAFANKKNTKEGVALLYNRSKFKLFSVENVVLSEALQTEESIKWLLELAFNNETLKERLLALGTCVLLAVLQSTDDPLRYLIVANTHLYFHPKAGNIRIIQTAVTLNAIQEKLKYLKETTESDSQISYVVCGDLNSKTSSGAIEYILSGKLPYSHTDWYSGGISEYHSSTLSLVHNLKLLSACGFPRYTNYAAGFYECLDYILINSDHLKVDKVVEAPDHDLVVKHTALPSVIAPSDHIAQIADLSWLPQDERKMQL